MNMLLRITSRSMYGVMGDLLDEDNNLIAVTLQHAYAPDFMQKLPVGTYTCQRGQHRLHNLIPFETFEVMDVPGHTGILFHIGNYNSDSDGCILLGSRPGAGCILDSKAAFEGFMEKQAGVDTFILIVQDIS